MRRCNTASAWSTRRWRSACVRCIQLTDHLVDDVEQLLTIADELNEWTILRARGVPVHAVHVWIVETIFHRAPTVVKHLGPLRRTIDANAHVEIDPSTSWAFPTWRRCGGGCSGAWTSGCQRHRVNTIALAEENRAAIARDAQVRNTAPKTAATAGTTFTTFVRRLAGSDSRQTTPVLLNRVKHRQCSQARGLGSYEDDCPAVGGDRVVENRKRHARDLSRAAFETVPVDLDLAWRTIRRRSTSRWSCFFAGFTRRSRRFCFALFGVVRIAVLMFQPH